MKRVFLCVICFALFSCNFFQTTNSYDMQLMSQGKAISMVECSPDGSIWGLRVDGSLIHYSGAVLQVYDSENSIYDSTYASSSDICTDEDGRIWIANTYFIKRFDGASTTGKSFFSAAAGQSLPIIDIEIDSSGDVWCSPTNSSSGGLAHNHYVNWDKWYVLDSLILPSFPGQFEFDSKGQIWTAVTGIEDSYFAMYNGSSWQEFDADDLGFNPTYVTELAIIADDVIVGYIDHSLFSAPDASQPDYIVFSEEEPEAEQIFLDGDASLLISRGSNYYASREIWYNYADSCLVSADESQKISFPEVVDTVFTISNDANGDLWLGTDYGLYKVER